MIVCLCRGKSDRDVQAVVDAGASSLRDLMRCGFGDQCGSCHNSLRGMLARATAAKEAARISGLIISLLLQVPGENERADEVLREPETTSGSCAGRGNKRRGRR